MAWIGRNFFICFTDLTYHCFREHSSFWGLSVRVQDILSQIIGHWWRAPRCLTSASLPSPISFESFPSPLTCIFIFSLHFLFPHLFSSKLFYSLPGICFSLALSFHFFIFRILLIFSFLFLYDIQLQCIFESEVFFLLWCFFTYCSNYIWIDSANLRML